MTTLPVVIRSIAFPVAIRAPIRRVVKTVDRPRKPFLDSGNWLPVKP